jgi:hypothetical protein
MRNDLPEDDPKKIWQTQPTEPSAMILDKIRQKTLELHAKTRWDLMKSIAGPFTVVAIGGFGMQFSGAAPRMAFAFAAVWSLLGLYFLTRGMRPPTLPGDAALGSGLESYRWEVERRRYLSGRFLLWHFGPVALALATLIVTLASLALRRVMLLNLSPFLTLIVIWIVGVFVVRMRQRRQLQREIDELNEIERVNR